MMKPIPTAAKAYGILLQEQVHQEISKGNITNEQDYVACRVEKRKFYDHRNKGKGDASGTKRQSNFYCDHSKVPGHTRDRCWKIHGYPPKFKNTWRKDGKMASNVSNAECINTNNANKVDEARLIAEQLGQLLSLLNKPNVQMEAKQPPNYPCSINILG